VFLEYSFSHQNYGNLLSKHHHCHQVVARSWDIEKFGGETETVRGSGIMSTQPIIAPGDTFTYQSVCPLKVFPPKGKRMLGSMSGAYTMCKGKNKKYI
jgi:uncharacterized protein affecting Mg2+/Co2+ transport